MEKKECTPGFAGCTRKDLLAAISQGPSTFTKHYSQPGPIPVFPLVPGPSCCH
jgi:hypothetical protein